MRSRLSKRQWIYAALAAVLTISAAGILGAVYVAADRQNRAAVATQQRIAESLTSSLLQALASNVTTEVYWQEAYESTVVGWDQEWVAWNYGDYLDSLDVAASVVYAPDGSVRFRHISGSESGLGENDLDGSPALAELYRSVTAGEPAVPPEVARGFLLLGGDVFYGAAGYITPEQTDRLPAPDQRHVVTFLRRIAPAHYSQIAEYFNIGGLEIRGPAEEISGKASIPLRSVDGQTVARLWWTPDRPGGNFMAIVVPVSICVFLLLGLVLYLMLRNWRTLSASARAAHETALAAQEESRMKTAFLASASHELRTPLNAIIGFSDFIRQELLGPIGNPQYKDHIAHIHESGTHLLRIINDLLDLAKIEARQARVSCVEDDVRAVVDQTCDMLQVEADRKGIRLERPPAGRPVIGYFDQHALLRVFINVVGNALKFTDTGGAVVIRLFHNAEQVVVTVRDTGIGIRGEDLAKLGRPFAQVEGERARHGTGLGLSISMGLITLMNGDLIIESEFGKGTMVSIKLPARRPREAANEPAPQAAERKAA